MKFLFLFLFALLAAGPSRAAELNTTIIDLSTTVESLYQGAVSIDNRPGHKCQAGHIKGAVNFPFFQKNHPSNRMTKEKLLQALGDEKVIVFYCSGAFRAYHALLQAKDRGINAEMYWYKPSFPRSGYNEA